MIGFQTPGQVLRNESSFWIRASKIQRFDRRAVNQHISEMMTVKNRRTVGLEISNKSSGKSVKAANVQRNFVVKDSDTASYDGFVALFRRPRETGPGSNSQLVRNTLIFVSQSYVDAQVWPKQPTIL